MESPACGGVASCAGQHAACLHPPRGRRQQGSALPCSLLSQWTWWASIQQIGGCVPSTGFTLYPHPPQSLPIPSYVFCTQAVGDRARVLETVADCVMVPYHCAGRARGVKGARPCLTAKGRRDTEGTLLPTDDTTLLLNVWKIIFVEYGGGGGGAGNWFRNMSLMHAVFWMPVNFEMLVCWKE